MHAFLFFRSSIILKRRHLRIASNFFSHICCLKIQKQKKKEKKRKREKHTTLCMPITYSSNIYIYKIILNEKFEHNTESEAGNDTYSGSSHISLVDLWYR